MQNYYDIQEMRRQEERRVSSTGGEKGVKEARYDLIPVEALEKLAILYGRGAAKYEDHNWRKGYDWSKSYAALQRHANSFWRGEDIDEEMGLPHLAAVAFHAFTLMTFMEEQENFDDRYVQTELPMDSMSELEKELIRKKLDQTLVYYEDETVEYNKDESLKYDEDEAYARAEAMRNHPAGKGLRGQV